MSQLVTRKGDVCTGHGCFPSRPSIEGSPTIFADGISVVRVGDAYDTHCCLRGNTLVYTLEYSYITIKEILELLDKGVILHTLSKFDKTNIVSQIIKGYETKIVSELLQVELGDGSLVEVTPEHKFLLKDGITYKEAKYLTREDELCQELN